ncbi:MAG: fibronectin type III domain-containing protein [Verrucomicrobiota bacterium]
MIRIIPWLFGLFAAGVCALAQTETSEEASPRLHSVLLSAAIQSTPPQIMLTWPGDTNATFYRVSRKTASEPGWTALSTLRGDATQLPDTNVVTGVAYEYQVLKTTAKYTGYGYLSAGIELPLGHDRGKVILIAADTTAASLSSELDQWEQDCVGDGWTVARHSVSPDDSASSVKTLIRTEFAANPAGTQAVFLFGRVPVPYSGSISPDGHTNHQGAWPADVYYGDMTGDWTDSTVDITSAERPRNWNTPGDGKFDQSIPPGRVDLQVGRVDFAQMTTFANKTPPRSELDLLRQYLDKNHRFRTGGMPVARKGLICDNFFDKGIDPVGCSGWRNFSAFFGPDGIVEAGWSNYFPAVTRQSYLWSFASGGGQFTTCVGVGSADDFARQDVGAVFTMWLGSYFGDWDNESNFLRASLGSTSYTLTASYSGFPQWLYHPMALGATVGSCARLTQNNRPRGLYPPYSSGVGQVHIALLGDPTLRMHPVSPPTNVTATQTNEGVQLAWTASSDSEIRGYHVFRSAAKGGPYLQATGDSPITDLTWFDSSPDATRFYLVRAIKLEKSSGGTYWNSSGGAWAEAQPASEGDDAGARLTISDFTAAAIRLRLVGTNGLRIVLESSADLQAWTALTNALLGKEAMEYTDDPAGASHRFYRARPGQVSGQSPAPNP